jgi:hypothetical protein
MRYSKALFIFYLSFFWADLGHNFPCLIDSQICSPFIRPVFRIESYHIFVVNLYTEREARSHRVRGAAVHALIACAGNNTRAWAVRVRLQHCAHMRRKLHSPRLHLPSCPEHPIVRELRARSACRLCAQPPLPARNALSM